jgi:hypothetical protein
MRNEARALRKALKEVKAARLEQRLAFILYQVNGFDNAMAYVRGLEQNCDRQPIPTTEENAELGAT